VLISLERGGLGDLKKYTVTLVLMSPLKTGEDFRVSQYGRFAVFSSGHTVRFLVSQYGRFAVFSSGQYL
jgi:hypothetical protein